MKTPIKVMFGLAVAVVAGLALLIAAVALFVNPNDYRDEIASAVRAQTGREMAIDGDLSLSLLPCCGISLGRTTLSNPPGFADPHFASLDSARLGLQLWPLITRQELLVGALELRGLDLALVRRRDGAVNWTFESVDDKTDKSPAAPSGQGDGLESLSVDRVAISGAKISLHDEQNKIDYRLDELNLSTGRLSSGEPADVETDFRFTDVSDGSKADVTLKARASLGPEASRLRLEDATASLSLSGAIVSGSDIDLDLRLPAAEIDAADDLKAGLTGLAAVIKARGGELGKGGDAAVDLTIPDLKLVSGDTLRADAASATARISASGGALGNDGQGSADLAMSGLKLESGKALRFESAAFKAGGSASGGELGKGGEASFNLQAAGLTVNSADELKLDATQLQFDVNADAAALPGGKARAIGKLARLGYAGKAAAWSVQGLDGKFAAAGADLTVSAAGRYAERGTQMQGDFQLAQLSPRKLLEALDQPVPVTSDPAVLTRAEATGSWQLGDDQLRITGLKLVLDDTRVTGDFTAANFARPAFSFTLAGDSLDLDRYLAPESAGDSKPAKDEAGSDQQTTKTLRDLNLDGRLSLGKLVASGTRLEDVQARVTARDGIIRLDPATAKLYGGSYAGGVVLDASGETLAVELDQSLDSVQAAGLLGDLAEMTELEGLLGAKIKAAGKGSSQQELLRSLNGNLSFQLADGVYKGMDIWQEIRSARARLRREPPPAATGPAQTRINALEMIARFDGGVLKSERMVAEIPFLRLNGSGGLNLLDQTLNYNFQAKVFETPTFADGESYPDLLNRSLPLTIGGTVENPKVGIDLAKMATDIAVEKATDKLLDRLGIGTKKPQPAPAPAQPGTSQPAPPDQAGTAAQPAAPASEDQAKPAPPAEEDPREALKKSLRDLINR